MRVNISIVVLSLFASIYLADAASSFCDPNYGTVSNCARHKRTCNGIRAITCCQLGCECNNGFVFDEATNTCVLPEQCSSKPGLISKVLYFATSFLKRCECDATKNEVWDTCSNCYTTCQTAGQKVVLRFLLGRRGCRCDTGYIFDESVGECIPLTQQCGFPVTVRRTRREAGQESSKFAYSDLLSGLGPDQFSEIVKIWNNNPHLKHIQDTLSKFGEEIIPALQSSKDEALALTKEFSGPVNEAVKGLSSQIEHFKAELEKQIDNPQLLKDLQTSLSKFVNSAASGLTPKQRRRRDTVGFDFTKEINRFGGHINEAVHGLRSKVADFQVELEKHLRNPELLENIKAGLSSFVSGGYNGIASNKQRNKRESGGDVDNKNAFKYKSVYYNPWDGKFVQDWLPGIKALVNQFLPRKEVEPSQNTMRVKRESAPK